MFISEKIVQRLRGAEVTEKELVIIYNEYWKEAHDIGFNRGCDYIRTMMRKQKMFRQQKIKDKCAEFLSKIDDYLHDVS